MYHYDTINVYRKYSHMYDLRRPTSLYISMYTYITEYNIIDDDLVVASR